MGKNNEEKENRSSHVENGTRFTADANRYAPEDAASFFEELIMTMADTGDIRRVYRRYGHVLWRFLDARTALTEITFAGPFAKMDYLLKEHGAKWWLRRAANDARVRIRKSYDESESRLRATAGHDLKALCQFIAFVDDTTIPEVLISLFPADDGTVAPARALTASMRMIVAAWDDDYVYGVIDGYSTDGYSKVAYTATHPTFPTDWGYLRDLFRRGSQLNLIRPHADSDGILRPEMIIFEPDYLVNVTTIARCMTHYADAPEVELINKIEPSPDNWPIILGNFAGQLLDEELAGKSCIRDGHLDRRRYAVSVRKFFSANALSMLTAKAKPGWNFHDEAVRQAAHIHKAVGETLPREVGDFNAWEGIVEPSFFSPMLGIQGRMDFLQMDYHFLVEQKSGNGAFPYDHFVFPRMTDSHFAQLLLYMLLFRFNYRQRGSDASLTPMLMYSKYEQSMLRVTMVPERAFEAMRIRNGIVARELALARHGGYHVYDDLSAEKLNMKGVGDRLWNDWERPRIDGILDVIHNASALERSYFFRFMEFISNEHVMAKLGNKTKECSGFASTWYDSLDAKRLAGNIYDNLTLVKPDSTTEGEIDEVTLAYGDDIDCDMSNFRQGDIGILYPYDRDREPDATAGPVVRCKIRDITKDNRLVLTLRHPQADRRLFDYNRGRVWAIEHDFMEASFSGLYQGMFSLLTAPKERRDLLLFQREPKVDVSRKLKGDYGSFNTMMLKVKRARDFFLIIGPPGTGKTSFGLLNTLKEELCEDGSTVLLMSYTNRAVDEICSKLKGAGIDFIRIGGETTAQEAYANNLISRKIEQTANIAEARQMIVSSRVFVGTTTAISSHLNLFEIKQFDLAIIDEASQILEPHLMGILSAQHEGRAAIRKFVMIGDEKQLPAVVQQSAATSAVEEPELRAIMLTDCRNSLFERLLRRYHDNGDVVAMLDHQGRMHPAIAEFPNIAFYHGQLKAVPLAHQETTLPEHGNSGDLLTDMLLTRRVAFIDAAKPAATTSDKVNIVEAEIIAGLVRRIYDIEKATFDADETVGVIVPYRNQTATVRKLIDRYGIDILHNITIDTVERFQGSQRKYIIYGFTVQEYYQLNFLTSNVYEESDGTVIDRKLNVAMTRAEEHLVMVGHAPLLEKNPTFRRLIGFVKEREGYIKMEG